MEHSPSTSPLAGRLLRLAGLVAVLALALSASGCNKDVQTLEAKEGGRVFVDNLFYQVQILRQLNPKDVEDSTYLQGQPAPAPGDEYFGVFMRVDNETSNRRILPVGTRAMKITTASGQVFRPIPVKASGWGWAPAPIGKGAMLPIPNTPAYVGPIRGGLVLFRMPQSALNSRPVKLSIKGPDGRTGVVTLDI